MGVYWAKAVMSTKTIAIPDTVYERVRQIAAAEGTTVDQVALRALTRELARRWLDDVGREGDRRRRGMTDADVEALVERAVQECRRRS